MNVASDYEAKFPRTPHLLVAEGLELRDDKVLSAEEAKAMLSFPLVLEEKVDGANLGIAFDGKGEPVVRNRGSFVGPGRCHPQFERLWAWLYERKERLFDRCGNRLAVFGEWCAVKHSIRYDRLPDWFLGFDVRDVRTGDFWDVAGRDALFADVGVVPVRTVGTGRFTASPLENAVGFDPQPIRRRTGGGPLFETRSERKARTKGQNGARGFRPIHRLPLDVFRFAAERTGPLRSGFRCFLFVLPFPPQGFQSLGRASAFSGTEKPFHVRFGSFFKCFLA